MQKFSVKQQQTTFDITLKESYSMIKWDMIQGWFKAHKLTNVMYHINKIKDQNNMTF